MRPAGIGGDIAANGAGPLAGGIGGEVVAVRLEVVGKPEIDDAGLDDGEAIAVVHFEDALHARQGDDDAAADGQTAAGQGSAGAAGEKRDVEVVAGAKTSPETVERAISFYTSIGKKPIHVRKEVVGHVANRLQAALYREVVYLIEQGVLDVADSDAAVCWGPGLRWGLMGPNLLFHLGGGQGGIQHFMEHLSGPVATWWKDLGTITEFSPEVKQIIVNGVIKEANGRSIAELERERDEMLLELLATRTKGEKTAHAAPEVAAD